MKIVHIVQYYMRGHTYQENYLPAAMARLGHDVTVIAGTENPDFFTDAPPLPGETVLDKGVRIVYTRMRRKRFTTPVEGLYALLEAEAPALVFVHGFPLTRNRQLRSYMLRHPDCRFCCDTHETYVLAFNACFSGSLRDRVRYFLYFRCVYAAWRRMVQKHYFAVFYVAPPRRTYAVEALGFRGSDLVDLWLGADLATLPYEEKPALRAALRERLGLPADARVMMQAGKLDEKKHPVEVAEAFCRLSDPRWYLVYVGSIDETLKARVSQAAGDSLSRVRFTGLVEGDDVLRCIAGSDLAVYPGAHSVLWEQTACLGVPAVYYAPVPGDAAHLSDESALFVETGSADEVYACLKALTSDDARLAAMGERARKHGENALSYDRLAEKVLLLAEQAGR